MTPTGILTIDLAAIRANWLQLNARCASGVKTAAVIKASAYGLGAIPVGRTLYAAGAREFFFATKAEALIFAQENLPGACCYVLGGAAGEECEFIHAGLIPVLFSVAALRAWAEACRKLRIFAPSVIKINTGMTRLGLDLREFQQLCTEKTLLSAVSPRLIMSHLACADVPSHPLNLQQLNVFKHCVELAKTVLPGTRFSLANSSGIFLGAEWHFDLLRPGAALYGINPRVDGTNPMRNAVNLSLPILQVRSVFNEACVGYGGGVTVPDGTRLAVVAGGYADGLQCTLGLAVEGDLLGFRVRSVGRISMDSMVFDISQVDLPDELLQGVTIEVINSELTLERLMKKNASLGYEVLTSLGARFTRVYKGGEDE